MNRKFYGTAFALVLTSSTAPLSAVAQPVFESAGAPAEEATLAVAQDPFSALVGKRGDRKEKRSLRHDVERYVIATDNRVFLFENLGAEARLKFLCREDDDPRLDCRIDPIAPAEEIHVLTPNRGPRGDTIYKDVEGETLLRIASYGGATVFWPGDLSGQAASKSFGDDEPLLLPYLEIDAADRRAKQATAYLSAITGAPIVFDIEGAPSDPDNGAAVLADAIARAANGLARVANDPTGARVIASRVKGVRFRSAQQPKLSFNEGYLLVNYSPYGDLGGRPPSSAIARFLEESL